MADKEEPQIVKGILPILGVSTAVIVIFAVLVRTFAFSRRVYAQDDQYLVSVRYPGQWDDLRDFIQPHNPDVMAVYSQIGPDYWLLYDFVCRNIDYRRDTGEFWQTPSETLRGHGDCEDSSILLASLLNCFSNAYVALGSYQGYGHAWTVQNGFIYETTYTSASLPPDPEDYVPFVLFNDHEIIELWPGALSEVFELARDEPTKLNLMAKAVG